MNVTKWGVATPCPGVVPDGATGLRGYGVTGLQDYGVTKEVPVNCTSIEHGTYHGAFL
ncbi:MAG: hypothetical protein ACJAQ9_000920 [Ilumatobacter sp.]|jgi:hypothetical protein